MAEDENKKRGRLATAVLAGSALAFGSFVMGIPAAFADNEEKPEVSDPTSTESGTPEAPNDVDNEESPSATGDQDADERAADDQPSASASATSEDGGDFGTQQVESDVSIDKDQVWPGDTVTVTGSGFTPDAEIVINLVENDIDVTEGPQIGTVTTDSQGAFTVTVTIPEDTQPRDYNVSVYDEADLHTFGVPLEVLDDSDVEVAPQVSVYPDEVQPGDSLSVSGHNLTPNANATLSWNSEVEPETVTATESGHINAELEIPQDTELGLKELTVTDEETGGSTIVEFTVVDGSDEVTEPTLTISPDEITLEDFIGEDEEDVGVTHTVEGLEPNTEINYEVTSPEGVQNFESTEHTNEDGDAKFFIHGIEGGDPSVYLGDYGTVVTFEGEDGETGELSGEFSVVEDTGQDPAPDPDEQLEIDLATNELYPGDTLEVSGTGFTPDGNVGLSWNPTAETTADADGNISTELVIPEDTAPGEKTLTVEDETSGESTTGEFTVLDPADQDTEPAMSIDPEEIAVEDFMGDPEEGAGVEHAVQGVAPGSEITYVVIGPAGVNDFESSGVVNDDGTADFVIYAPETSNPNVYLGDYTSVVTYENEDGETSELQGTFTVVEGPGGSGSGESDDQVDPVGDSSDPVDLNGSDNLARTGASNVQLGLIAGLLLAVGGALVVYTNRSQLFPRKK